MHEQAVSQQKLQAQIQGQLANQEQANAALAEEVAALKTGLAAAHQQGADQVAALQAELAASRQ